MTAASNQPAVLARDVSRHYPMGTAVVRALDGVSLQVAAGEFVALLGSSGSGKSTLLNLIGGLDRPSSGSVTVLGRDLARLGSKELAEYRRNTVGMIFQAFNLVPTMTLAENVELPMRFAEVERSRRGDLVREALERVGLADRARHRPSELSGGEQQRGSIARALVNRPALLLADEPTGNLDSHTGAEIMKLVQGLNREGMTVVLVTHERALADRYATRQVFLSDGRIAAPEPAEVAAR